MHFSKLVNRYAHRPACDLHCITYRRTSFPALRYVKSQEKEHLVLCITCCKTSFPMLRYVNPLPLIDNPKQIPANTVPHPPSPGIPPV